MLDKKQIAAFQMELAALLEKHGLYNGYVVASDAQPNRLGNGLIVLRTDYICPLLHDLSQQTADVLRHMANEPIVPYTKAQA